MMMMQRKPTATELLKALHNAWLLGPSSNNGNGNSGNDDADDGEPTDVVLAQLGDSLKHSVKTASSVARKGTWPRIAPQWAAATTTMAAAAAAEKAKATVASKAIATSVANQAICCAIAFLTRNRHNSRGRKKKLLEHQWRY